MSAPPARCVTKPRPILGEPLAGFLFGYGAKERTLTILGCYMDESSDRGGQKVFAVGAVIGNDTKWQWLRDEWEAVLKQEGIAYFRSNDCAAMTGQFLKFRKNKHKVTPVEKRKGESIRHGLLERIADSRVTGVGIAVDMEDFHKVANTSERLEAFGGTPYYHCYFLTMAQCALLIRNNLPGDALAFGYDKHQQCGPHLRNVYGDFKRCNPDIAGHMTTIAPFDDRTFVPVQVADIMASIVRKYTLWKIEKPRPSRPYELRVLNKKHIMAIMRVCGTKCLSDFLRQKGLYDSTNVIRRVADIAIHVRAPVPGFALPPEHRHWR